MCSPNQSRRHTRLTSLTLMAVITVLTVGHCGLTASLTHALSVAPSSLERAVRSADLIVYVTIGAQSVTSHDGAHGKRLMTLSALKVNQTLKGTVKDSKRPLTLSQPGGVLGDITQVIPGAPVLKEGQRWVLFLRYSQDGERLEITGGQRGARRVNDQGEVEITESPKTLRVVKPVKTLRRFKRLERVKASLKALPSERLKEIPQDPTRAASGEGKVERARANSASPKVTPRLSIKTRKNVTLEVKQSKIKLSVYLDKIKALVDRTQSPERPTH